MILFSSWQGEIVDNRGVKRAKKPKAIALPEEFKPGEKIKAFFGWDGIVICDDSVDLIDMALNYAEAMLKESCGKCTPCGQGSRFMRGFLEKLAKGEATKDDLNALRSLANLIKSTSKCSIGQTAPVPILHVLEYFSEEIEKRIASKKPAQPGNYRYAVTAPCKNACPSNLDIPRYVEEIKEVRFEESLATIREMTCLPGTLGRVCVRPCESNCRRALVEGPVSIKWLKRFAADFELEHRKKPQILKVPTSSGKRVAIVGAGPAGLSCAFYLALKGHSVTIFEKSKEPGGMATYGIPDYRLPRGVLTRHEVDIIKDLGVEIRYGVEVGKDVMIMDLHRDYDAVFIGVGAQTSAKMGIEGEDKGYRGFIPGVRYLYDINNGIDPYPEGKRVVVVGGGNVAMDCVRCSFRIGKTDVHLVYRRSRAEMPADPEEIHDAEEEGVVFHFLCNPTRIIEQDGKVVGVELIKMELGEPDQSGRRRPVPVPGSEFILETDILIPAIGQAVDLSFLAGCSDIKLTKWKTIAVNPDTFETSVKGIFAAGDCVTGPDVLVRAAGGGRRAAERIDQYLRGIEPGPTEEELFDKLFSTIKVFDKNEKVEVPDGMKRKELQKLDPETRKWTFEEVEKGYTPPEAIYEAQRCLRCYRIGMIAY